MTMKLKELSGTELVNVMNEVMAEVKSRLDEGTVTKYVAREIPSIVDEVETVEHDGKLLRKVGRKVSAGVYVKFNDTKNGSSIKNGIIYGPVKRTMTICDLDYDVFNGHHNRTADNVEVFEVVGNVGYIHHVSNDKPLTANQQRAELIQRAREFVEGQKNSYGSYRVFSQKDNDVYSCNAEFYVKRNKVTCLLRGITTNKVYFIGRAICMPGDVFNESIGKAIALAKALKIDIPREFLDAVQPDGVVVGMTVRKKSSDELRTLSARFPQQDNDGYGRAFKLVGRSAWLGENQLGQILDDTNAEYGESDEA